MWEMKVNCRSNEGGERERTLPCGSWGQEVGVMQLR